MPDEDTAVPRASFSRTFPLEDIAIRAGGDGRTVVAYAAVFDTPAEIRDADGHYIETLSRHAFDKTLAERANRVGVFYNHGKTLYGTPSERFSIPLGVPEEVRADERGVMTVTRYNRNALADEVLESIRNGDITGQSFSGKFLQSQRTRGRNGELDAITRNEIMLSEYGPTPIPAYANAAIVGVRTEQLVDALAGLPPDDRATVLSPYLTATATAGGYVITTTTTSSGTSSRDTTTPPPTDDADSFTSSVADAPTVHASPTPAERRARAIALKGFTS